MPVWQRLLQANSTIQMTEAEALLAQLEGDARGLVNWQASSANEHRIPPEDIIADRAC